MSADRFTPTLAGGVKAGSPGRPVGRTPTYHWRESYSTQSVDEGKGRADQLMSNRSRFRQQLFFFSEARRVATAGKKSERPNFCGDGRARPITRPITWRVTTEVGRRRVLHGWYTATLGDPASCNADVRFTPGEAIERLF